MGKLTSMQLLMSKKRDRARGVWGILLGLLHKRRLVILYFVYSWDISTRVSGDCLVAGGNAAIKPEEWRTITDSSRGTVPRGRKLLAPISSFY